jgi:hypothetical protein
MELPTSDPVVSSALTSDLVAKITQDTESPPEAHLLTPAAGELFETRDAALLPLQDWVFTQSPTQ